MQEHVCPYLSMTSEVIEIRLCGYGAAATKCTPRAADTRVNGSGVLTAIDPRLVIPHVIRNSDTLD